MLSRARLIRLQFFAVVHLATSAVFAQENKLPTLDEVLASKQDLWGLAAMQQPNGPSYEFFEKLLPPLRYVNAEFKYYPIVLSAPNAVTKARLVSNGSAINARAGIWTWKEFGTPVTFTVGDEQEQFGQDFVKLKGPTYQDGFLPIIHFSYEHENKIFEEEVFAGVEDICSSQGIVFVKFTLKKGDSGIIAANIGVTNRLRVEYGTVSKTNGETLWFGKKWSWDASQNRLTARLSRGQSATLAIATTPVEKELEPFDYAEQRQKCMLLWKKILGRSAQFQTPELLMNQAYRAVLANNFMLLKVNRPNYSAGNLYERLYQAECGDVARSFMLFGYEHQTLFMLSHMFDYTRDKLEFHNAGFKLQQFSHWYWMTRDKAGVESLRAKWEKEIKLIINGREKESGIFPKERYCGDIAEKVYSLNPNAGCWRGLRDFAAVLDDIGEHERAKELFAVAKEFRAAIMKAVEKSEFRDTNPPFMPIQLFGKEKPYDKLTDTMVGSYWNLLAPYIIGSGIFAGTERDRWMVDYLHEHSGICMGMIRFDQHSGLFANEDAVDDLYSIRYTQKLFQLDEVDRALVSFYGKLAQGLTRDTFIGAEGTGLRPLDEHGRAMYLPPNSTAQAYFLWMLRYLAIQDWDMNDDGKPETLRLLFATPKRWLEDGKEIIIERAPTAFGEVSMKIKSRLSKGEVVAQIDLPERNHPEQTLLRIRVPDGWRVVSAKASAQELKADEKGTVDISSLKGKISVHFAVKKTVK